MRKVLSGFPQNNKKFCGKLFGALQKTIFPSFPNMRKRGKNTFSDIICLIFPNKILRSPCSSFASPAHRCTTLSGNCAPRHIFLSVFKRLCFQNDIRKALENGADAHRARTALIATNPRSPGQTLWQQDALQQFTQIRTDVRRRRANHIGIYDIAFRIQQDEMRNAIGLVQGLEFTSGPQI